MLQAAAWKDVEVIAVDLPCSLARDELPAYVGQLGPVGLALRELPEAQANSLRNKAVAAFTPFFEGDRVRVDAACWLIRARA